MQKLDLVKINIRQAVDKDLFSIIQLLADDELGKGREARLTEIDLPDSYLKAFNLIQSNPSTTLVVMEYMGEIIGTLQLIIIPTLTLQGCIRAEVEGVRIKSTFRRFGLGKLMFNWTKNTAIEKGCSLLQLTTNKNRLSAINFYKSIGFIDSHYGMKMDLSK
ncbi:MAG: family N-acetyltransferase [Burkholderiales bacterium]|jgi:ribosomal protein S18 acetylase RimI-like enzyme|nr:family N-acetyltransferase [Burkholderiales bacterium]